MRASRREMPHVSADSDAVTDLKGDIDRLQYILIASATGKSHDPDEYPPLRDLILNDRLIRDLVK